MFITRFRYKLIETRNDEEVTKVKINFEDESSEDE